MVHCDCLVGTADCTVCVRVCPCVCMCMCVVLLQSEPTRGGVATGRGAVKGCGAA